MQIPDNPFKFLEPGIPRPAQPGGRPRIDGAAQAKERPAGARPGEAAATAGASAPRANLRQAVESLAAQGRLPPRGSLLDLKV